MRVVARFDRSIASAGVIFTMGSILQPLSASATTSSNLILNPGDEAGAGSTGGVVPVPIGPLRPAPALRP